MNTEEKEILKGLINTALDQAEASYKKVEDQLLIKANSKYMTFSNESVETELPGFPLIEENEPHVANFIALILDVRGSTKHLLEACASCGVQQLERTVYETAAINALGSYIIKKHSGGITEFLGDGFLAFFLVKTESDMYPAKRAAEDCLEGREVLNAILASRYTLPAINYGIGLAYSQAIIMVVNANGRLYPKAIGECVYRASKLSSGFNKILYDDSLRYSWPTSKGGSLTFKVAEHRHKNDVKGYETEMKN